MKYFVNFVFVSLISIGIEFYFTNAVHLGRILLVTFLAPVVLCAVWLAGWFCLYLFFGQSSESHKKCGSREKSVFKEYSELYQKFIHSFGAVSFFRTTYFQMGFYRTCLLFKDYFSSVLSFIALCQMAFIFGLTPMDYVNIFALSKIIYYVFFIFMAQLALAIIQGMQTGRYILNIIGSLAIALIVTPLMVGICCMGYVFLLLFQDDVHIDVLMPYAWACVLPMLPMLLMNFIKMIKTKDTEFTSFDEIILPVMFQGFFVILLVVFFSLIFSMLKLVNIPDEMFSYLLVVLVSLPYGDFVYNGVKNEERFKKKIS